MVWARVDPKVRNEPDASALTGGGALCTMAGKQSTGRTRPPGAGKGPRLMRGVVFIRPPHPAAPRTPTDHPEEEEEQQQQQDIEEQEEEDE